MPGPPVLSDAQLAEGGAAFVSEASGTGEVLAWRTDDLGAAFRPLLRTSLVGAGAQLYGIFFLDGRRGFVCGESAEGRALALSTRDGGTTWDALGALLDAAGGSPITQIFFLDADVGFAISSGEALWRTADGGRSWSRPAADGLDVFGAFFLDGTSHGWFLSQTVAPGWKILRTQHFETLDGGLSFRPLADRLDGEPARMDVAACGFWDESVGAVCGPGGFLARTDDGGRTWSRTDSGTDLDLNFLALAGRSTAYAAGARGLFLRTDDRGRAWRRLPTGVVEQLHAAAFADPERGFVVGEGGTGLWTRDGGRTFQPSRFELRS